LAALFITALAWSSKVWAQEPPTAEAPAAPAAQPTPPATPVAQPAAPLVGPKTLEESNQAGYGRLADAIVQKELVLTAEQKQKISQLLGERSAALAQAAAVDKPGIVARIDAELGALLTDEQRARMATLEPADTRRLRFSFRFQPWADVLNWFAEQADLSLVLDAPPPGTFNYTDSREYTVPEAIDLLNGVLMTKNYTLLRRERMLMVLDLTTGVPADLIPRLTLDEIDRRGKFELVSVAFPVGDLNAEEVKTEITPLLGPHGKVSVLTKTKQILVSDTAGKMRAIGAVIESIPKADKPAAPTGDAPAAALAVYPLGGLDAKATTDVLSALFSDTKVVVDPKVDQLMIYAVPERQAAIQAVLAQLRADNPPEKKPLLERYPIRAGRREQVLEVLRLAVPAALLRVDPDSGDLLAWATPKEQQTIREQIDELGAPAAAAAERQLEVYPLRHSDPATVLALLQKMLPDARLAVDAGTKSIVALASPEEQRAVAATLEQLESRANQRQTLVFYPVKAEQRKRVQAVLASLDSELPGMRIVTEAGGDGLAIFADPKQHELIKSVIEQCERELPPAEQFKVVAYRLKAADPASVLTALQTLLPEVKFVVDAKARQVVAWARPADHERIAEAVAELDAELPAEQRIEIMSHPLGKADATAVLLVLRSLIPEVTVTSDTKNVSLVAWARKRDQEVIRRAIAGAQPDVPEGERPSIVVYEVPDADPIQVAAMLATVVPTGRFTGDRATAKLAAWATPEEQQLIKETVDGMRKGLDPNRDLAPVVYRPKTAEITALLYDLRVLAPEARFSANAVQRTIVAWAKPADQEKIRATIEGLDPADNEASARVSAVYAVPDTDSATLLQVLTAAVPDAKLVSDARSGTVIAWARADQHETLKRAVDGLAAQGNADNRRTARVYRFRTGDANATATVLRYVVPYAYLAVDTRTGSLAATATPAEHEQIAAMVREVEGEGDNTNQPELRVYRLQAAEPTTSLAMLRELFAQRAEVRLSLDPKGRTIVAWALPSQHELIDNVLKRVDRPIDEGDLRQLEVYQLGDADPDSVKFALSQMFADDRNVRIVTDEAGGLLTVYAVPPVQATVRSTIEQMQGRKNQLEVIELEVVDPYSAEMAIERLFGDETGRAKAGAPRIEADAETRQLLVRASKEQLVQIRELLVKMGESHLMAQAQGSQAGDRRMRVLRINDRSVAAALAEIERVWPRLRKNPIRVVTPSAVAPTLRESRKAEPAAEAPATDAVPATKQGATAPSANDGASTSPRNHRVPLAPPVSSQLEDALTSQCVDAQCSEPSEAAEPPAPRRAADEPVVEAVPESPREVAPANAEQTPSVESTNEPSAAEQPATDQPAARDGENSTAPVLPDAADLAPIIIAPAGDSVTIASDDPEALDQFEQLLRSFSQRSGAGGRDFTIFYLKRANALDVADTLENVLRGGGLGFRGYGGPVVVPDSRLNALIVHASRGDLETIEGLIETLDSSEVSESAIGSRPRLIPVRNSDVDRIAEILRDVYKTKLTAGAGQRRQRVPRRDGMSRDMAFMMAQMEAEATGPEMTIGVDRATNSIVVSAPPRLVTEIESLVRELDEQSDASRPTVKVLALTKTNTKAVRKALESMVQDAVRSGRRGP
jgi:type II secretory pathway component GspD/PulD (secretin)